MLTDRNALRRCPGCGAPFQSDEPHRAGFIPPEIDVTAPGVVCRRCWRARHYRAWEPGAPGVEEARQGAAAAIRAADLVVWVVDIADFEGTAHPSLLAPWPAAAGKLWVAVNKTDLLPRHVPPAEVAAWVREQLGAHGLDPRGVSLLSAATGAGIKSFWLDVADAVAESRPRGRGGAVALLGATNTGKSRLIGRLADVGGAVPEVPPTVSAFPGMTAAPVRVPVPGGPELWDTPGLDTGGGRLSDRLCPACASRLVPAAPLQGELVELRPGQGFHWPALAGIEVVDGPPDGPGLISAYGPEAAGGARTRAERLLQGPFSVCGSCAARLREGPWTRVELEVEPRRDVAIAGLGWVTVRRGPLRLRLHVPEGVWYRVRPNLVGPKEARDWTDAPRMGAGLGKGAGPVRVPRSPSRQRRETLEVTRMLRYLTAGESHGPGLTAIVEGLPAGLAVEPEHINRDLRRRQGGYGRGGRMKIEKDEVRILSGIRFGQTLGSPITLHVVNRDYEHWTHLMNPEPVEGAVDDGWGPRPASGKGVVTRPRPGHADLAGAIKYRQRDVRNILERASARETTMRVAVGALAKRLLDEFGIRVVGHVVNLGGIEARVDGLSPEAIAARAEASPVRCADEEASRRMVARIDEAKAAGDTLGGVWEVIVTGVPPGLGSHVQADRRLDTRLAAAVMSIPAHKGVEVGLGFRAALMPGSRVHDEIFWGPPPEGDARAREALYPGGPVWGTGYWRGSNHAGGLEGGITNGLPIVVRGAMKPISTLYSALQSVDMETKEPQRASVQRSDICALPAAAVVGEAAVAIEVARAFLEKFGNDTMAEVREAFERYRAYLREV